LSQLYEAAILKNLIIIKLLKIDFFEKTNFLFMKNVLNQCIEKIVLQDKKK